ncbi:BEM46 family protein-like protein [Xylogone sp. PMI_703]|nr:BEM46 family protein-like protein [Xylogone sp. PMI_703]
MASQNAPPASAYLEQMSTVAGTVASYMRLPVLVSSGIAVVVSSLLYFKQKSLIYPSHLPADARTKVPRPTQFGISPNDYEELTLPTSDGENLFAFFIRPPVDKKRIPLTILMFHGNAGNVGHRIPIARMLVNTLSCSVMMLEYRGYGLSTGSPDENGITIDANTAWDWLSNNEETKDDGILVYGQSLGGAVSIKLVGKRQSEGRCVGLILENTFLSMRKLIPSVLPPARYLAMLCHQVWASDAVIPTITEVPILFLSGLLDEIVPPDHMRRLFELATTPTKIWKTFPAGDHNSSVLEVGYFEAIQEFVNNLDIRRAAKKKEKRVY